MNILVINYEYPPLGGGGGVITKDIYECLARQGHFVTVITTSYKGLYRNESVNGVNIVRVPVVCRINKNVANIVSMISYLPSCFVETIVNLNRYKKFEIINTHFAIPSGPSGYLISKLTNIPNVLSIHGGDIFDPSKSLSPHKNSLLRRVVQFFLNSAECVVAQSNNTKSNARKFYDLKRSIDIIPLGIPEVSVENMKRQEFGIDDGEFIFCSIARFVKRKNIDESFSILSDLKANHKFKFFIIGDGPEYFKIKKSITRYNLNQNVHLLGNLSDEEKYKILNIADCYISTSLHEGFGLVFLEAMHCGLPVVCYDNGGHTDFLVDGKTGFLVKLGDKAKFKRRLIQLIEDDSLSAKISFYNKELVKGYYVSNCSEQYLSLFNRILFDRS